MKILFVHLLNNYTGSPRVLATFLEEFSKDKNFECHLLTSDTEGFLSKIPNVQYHTNHYTWTNNKCLLTFRLLITQIYLFFFVLFSKDYSKVYINTILPFGATLGAKLKRIPIIYHVHEVYVKDNMLKKYSSLIMRKKANTVISVSEYVAKSLLVNSTVIYNSVPLDFELYANNVFSDELLHKRFNKKMIFMPTSLKEYKGIYQFVELAKKMPDFTFLLIVSCSEKEKELFLVNNKLSENITVLSVQSRLEEYYQNASLSVNLSLYDKFIETFGMTILESFVFGIPCVSPMYGGPKELIDNGENGFFVNPYNIEEIKKVIETVFSSFETYKVLSINAKIKSENFQLNKSIQKIKKIILES